MRTRVLGRTDRRVVDALVDADPVCNVFVASRLDAGVLERRTPGELWGYPGGRPSCLVHVGANLVPVNTDADARAAFAEKMGPRRSFVAIVGPVAEVAGLWQNLTDLWGEAYSRYRIIREAQPVLAMDRRCPIPADPRVRKVGRSEFEAYFEAAVAMYTEELGESPLDTNAYGYRRYVSSLVDGGRAFGIVEDGEVLFKADIGAIGHGVAQVQGVWVHPRVRGQGWASPAMAAVTNAIVASGRTASLYVNDFNRAALATYRRCGYTQRATFSTVLY